ncbi:tetratricopeptide repeat protein [Roseivirga sp.]|uniref:tetratricopeptide repeat protein n=1 Tax=Roseivirga sp. TaxID=1964215 RepID=UPI003B8D1965
MNLSKLTSELKRRNVFKVATAYAVTGWLLIQIAVSIEKPLSLPDWLDTVIILTVLIGFPVALIIAWVYEWTNEGLQKTDIVDTETSITSTTGKKLNRVIISSLTVLIVFLLVERIFFVGNFFIEEKPSVAVLPFVNQSTDPENAFFADGLAEELLNELAHVEGLRVIARTSSFSFKDKDLSLKEIADKLNVDHILTGSVRKSGDQLRISTELVKIEDETSIWSQAYDRESSDIFDIQSEIAKSAIKELRVELLPQEVLALEDKPTKNAAAYELYLRANQIRSNAADTLQLEIELLNQAISLDPEFAKAHASLVLSYDLLNQYGNFPYDQTLEKMEYHVNEALKHSSNDPDAYRARAWFVRKNFSLGPSRFKEVIEDLERVVELVPNHALAFNDLQISLRDQNRILEADSVLLIAWELDPLNKAITHNVAGLYANRGETEKAIEIVEEALVEHPNFAPLYTQMIGFMRNSPYGRTERAFLLAHEANKRFPKDVGLLDKLVELSQALDLPPVSEKYLSQFITLYPENFTAMTEMISSKFYQKKYDDILIFTETILQRFGEVAARPMANLGIAAHYQKGDYDRVIELIDEFFPEVYDLKLSPDQIQDAQSHDDLSATINIYTYILIAQKDKRASDYIEKVGQHMTYHDSIADRRRETRRKVFSELIVEENKVSVSRLFSQLNLAAMKGEVGEAVALIDELYFGRRAYANAFIDLQTDPVYDQIFDSTPFQDILSRIKDDVKTKRNVVIEFLKEQGEWQESWTAQLN